METSSGTYNWGRRAHELKWYRGERPESFSVRVPYDDRLPNYIDHTTRIKRLGLTTLVSRREIARITFAARVAKNPSVIPSLDAKMRRTPAAIRGRHKKFFQLPFPRTLSEGRNPVYSLQRTFNQYQQLVDLSKAIPTIKANLRKHFQWRESRTMLSP